MIVKQTLPNGLTLVTEAMPQVRSVALHDGTLAIVRDANGRINLIKDPVPGQPRPARDLPDVTFSQAVITYSDARSGQRIEARGCEGEVGALHSAGGERRPGGVRHPA